MSYLALAREKIPYQITNSDRFVRALMRIASTKPFIDEYLGTPLEVQLLRKARVRAVTYSNQIEGNTLEESEVSTIIAGKKFAGPTKDVKEVKNYYEALEYVEKLGDEKQKIKISDFLDIHRLVTRGLLPDQHSGKIRNIPVNIGNAVTKEVIRECPQPHALRALMDDLWKWIDDTNDLNPFARAFAFHFIAVSIHPFADGNGRSVRLMQHLLLLKDGESIAKYVPSETFIMKRRSEYYSALQHSRSLNSLDPILEFLAECFADSAEEVVAEAKEVLKKSASRQPESRKAKILQLAKKKREFGIKDVIEILSKIPRRTLERDLEQLVEERALKTKGEKRARVYYLNPNRR